MTETNSENALLVAVEQLTNLLAIAMTRDLRQVEAIRLLGRSSLSNAQIAAILGSTPDSIRAERNRLKREAERTGKSAAKPAVKKVPSDATVGG